jgi:hypothetical protein
VGKFHLYKPMVSRFATISTIKNLHAFPLRQISRRRTTDHSNIGVRFVNECSFAHGVAQVARTTIVHFIVRERNRIKHGYKIGGFVETIGRIRRNVRSR